LTRSSQTFERLVRQSFCIAAMQVGSLIALSQGARWATAVAISSGIVFVGVALVAAAFERLKRGAALALIIEGRQHLPLAAVQRQRRRLLAGRTRKVLARGFERIIADASSPRPPARVTALPIDRTVVQTVTPELRALVRLLRGNEVPVKGVALAQRLLTDSTTPLYGHEVEPLRQELRRVYHELVRRDQETQV
jgi:hypothetical protein